MTPRIILLLTLALLVLLALVLAKPLSDQALEEGIAVLGAPPAEYAEFLGLPPLPTTTTVVARARTAPKLKATSAAPAIVVGEPSDAQFDTLAGCESGGNWSANTGNGYFGGLQFNAQTWHAYGGVGLPHEHSREVQIEIARRLWRARGWQPWPSCSRRLGWR